MRRRAFLTKTGALAAMPALTGLASSRPKVLMISVDDMNDWVGCLAGYAM